MTVPRAGGVSTRLAALIVIGAWSLASIAWAQTAPKAAPRPTAPATPKPAAKPGTTTGSAAPVTKARAPVAKPGRPVGEVAREARELEDAGAYSRAMEALRGLRRRVPFDGDLELALALDEARSGAIDSAFARVSGPTIDAAGADSLPVGRRREYPYAREGYWLTGKFEGWHWYVWRARAELEAAKGRWSEALGAARQCVEARPLCGKEWHVLAVCAGRAGEADLARQAAQRATELDPTLPEAFYVSGLWDWKSGRRAAAMAKFRQAVALDSGFAPAALALIRSRIPGVAPDTLPAKLFTGVRRVALLTSPEGPKPEEFVQMDVSAILETSPDSAVVDSLVRGVKPIQLVVSVLVDTDGRAVLNEVPWFGVGQMDFDKVTRILRSIPSWRFQPAQRFGRPARVWVSVDYYLNP